MLAPISRCVPQGLGEHRQGRDEPADQPQRPKRSASGKKLAKVMCRKKSSRTLGTQADTTSSRRQGEDVRAQVETGAVMEPVREGAGQSDQAERVRQGSTPSPPHGDVLGHPAYRLGIVRRCDRARVRQFQGEYRIYSMQERITRADNETEVAFGREPVGQGASEQGLDRARGHQRKQAMRTSPSLRFALLPPGVSALGREQRVSCSAPSPHRASMQVARLPLLARWCQRSEASAIPGWHQMIRPVWDAPDPASRRIPAGGVLHQ